MATPLVGISQRQVSLAHGETRDCLDQAWTPFLEACGLGPVPLPARLARPWEQVRALGLVGIILSGGNNIPGSPDDLAPARDALELALLAEPGPGQAPLPILGVCRGMQMINHALGGAQRPLEGHRACTHGLQILPSPGPGLAGPVNSFHNYGLLPPDLAPGLRALALAPDGSVEALAHLQRPLLGIMWHPERCQPFRPQDLALFRRHFGLDPA